MTLLTIATPPPWEWLSLVPGVTVEMNVDGLSWATLSEKLEAIWLKALCTVTGCDPDMLLRVRQNVIALDSFSRQEESSLFKAEWFIVCQKKHVK